MKIKAKCCRCGKKADLKFSELKERWECSHCHLLMIISDSTKRRLKLVRSLFVSVIVITIFIGMKLAESGNYILLTLALVFSMALAVYAERICLGLTSMFFGLTHEAFHQHGLKRN